MDNAAKTRVVLVEDEGLFRDLLRLAFSQSSQVEIVGSFGDGPSALQEVPDLAPQVAILDIDLRSELNGIQVGLRLREKLPQLGIILLSNHSDPNFISSVPREVISGWSYLLKKSVNDVTTLERAITGSAAGFVVLDPNIVNRGQPAEGSLVSRLTPRQREVLTLIAQGFTNAAIAEKLVISEKSVENQINLIYQHLDLDRSDNTVQPRVKAVLTYMEESRFQGLT